MIVPYTLHPVPPRMAVLQEDGLARDEAGDAVPLEALDPGTQVWASHDLVWDLLVEGRGEALCWNGQPIRWRPERTARGWSRSASDVRVLRLSFPPKVDDQLAGLTAWRDWLAESGAAPQGSLGSSAWSLLRATISEALWVSVGMLPPIRYTIGGRQELGPAGAGSFQGTMRHWDLPAAYARTLGETAYGGRWVRADPEQLDWRQAAERGAPVFVRCQVTVPEGIPGPLPARPRRQLDSWDWLLFPIHYPAGCRIQGCWTFWELAAAEDAGCRINQVLDVFLHLSVVHPFARWWQTIQAGRSMGGFAGLLAKASGNALWGQFCIGRGQRTVQEWVNGRRRQRQLPPLVGRPRAPDLAEWVTGKVRAELYQFMLAAGDRLLSAHTDGGWCMDDGWRPTGWRSKDTASQLRVLNPQLLAYRRPSDDADTYVVAGWPPKLAAQKFEEQWAEAS